MSKRLDIKKISGDITNMAFQNIGYGEFKQYVYNTLIEIVKISYDKGAEDKAETMRNIKEAQNKRMNKNFNDILDELI